MKLIISQDIFEKHPNTTVGVLILRNIDNTKTIREIKSLLDAVEEEVKQKFKDIQISTDPTINAWRKVYRSFGSKDYFSSIENLVKRVVKNKGLPQINSLVDLYNYISLKHLLPVGGEDLDKVEGDIYLSEAKGEERFIPLLEEENNPPKVGEIVYKDSCDVLCRRWNWREADKTKLTEKTENAIIVIDATLEEEKKRVVQAIEEMKTLSETYLQATTQTHILDTQNNQIEL